MSKYRVLVKEISVCAYEVDTDSMVEALRLVSDGGGQVIGELEYHSTLDTDEWCIEKYNKEDKCIDFAEAEYVLDGTHKERM